MLEGILWGLLTFGIALIIVVLIFVSLIVWLFVQMGLVHQAKLAFREGLEKGKARAKERQNSSQ